MAIFKESDIKKRLDHIAQGNMTVSQFTQSINTEAYKYQAKRGNLVTMMDLVKTLDAFLVHNENCKNETQLKVNALKDYMKQQVIEGAKSHLNITTASIAGIQKDIDFVKSILPEHYEVQESKKAGSIHCKSAIGIRKSPYTIYPYPDQPERAVYVDDAEDDENWEYIFKAIKQHFGQRFQEVFHNTCFCHIDFTIYLKAG